MNENADFLVADHGSIVALTPMSEAANTAVADGLISYESWQLMGASIMVEHRIADDLIAHLQEDGFVVAPE